MFGLFVHRNGLQVQGFLHVSYKILTLYIRQKWPKSLSNLEFLFIQQALFITMLFLNSIQSLFNDDNKSGFLDFLNTTGVSFNRIVFARYLTGVSLCLISSIFSFLVNLIIYVFYKNLSLKSYLFIGLLTLCISLMYMLILIPFIYLFNQNGLTIAVILIILIAFILSKVNHSALKISNFFNLLT
ncbi:ABC-2 transporter permease [Heyndrickxia coagulans]|uniref:ABC-2 transporter permease n=1 Tax=Heyndrickxia coagulans TaxID=1398 RepID=UPI00399C6DBD